MRNAFTFNEVTSSSLGIEIESKNVYSAPALNQSFISVPGKDGDLLSKITNYKNIDISYSCFVIGLSNLRKIKEWLYLGSSEYHKLEDSYDKDFYRKAVYKGALDIEDTYNKAGSFVISFSCLPFKYANDGDIKEEFISDFTITNPYSFPSKPYIKITGEGNIEMIISSESDNSTWQFTDVDGYIEIDSEKMMFYKETLNKNSEVSGLGYPLFYLGENSVSFTGAVSKIEVIPRWVSL